MSLISLGFDELLIEDIIPRERIVNALRLGLHFLKLTNDVINLLVKKTTHDFSAFLFHIGGDAVDKRMTEIGRFDLFVIHYDLETYFLGAEIYVTVFLDHFFSDALHHLTTKLHQKEPSIFQLLVSQQIVYLDNFHIVVYLIFAAKIQIKNGLKKFSIHFNI